MTESTKLDPTVRRALEARCDVKLDYNYARADQLSRREQTFTQVICLEMTMTEPLKGFSVMLEISRLSLDWHVKYRDFAFKKGL